MQEGKRGGKGTTEHFWCCHYRTLTSLRNHLQLFCSWCDKQFANFQKKPTSRCGPSAGPALPASSSFHCYLPSSTQLWLPQLSQLPVLTTKGCSSKENKGAEQNHEAINRPSPSLEPVLFGTLRTQVLRPVWTPQSSFSCWGRHPECIRRQRKRENIGLLSNTTSCLACAQMKQPISPGASHGASGNCEEVSTNRNHEPPSERNNHPHNQPAEPHPTTTTSVTLHGLAPARSAPGKLPSAPQIFFHGLYGARGFSHLKGFTARGKNTAKLAAPRNQHLPTGQDPASH